jgi:hypothetical protein
MADIIVVQRRWQDVKDGDIIMDHTWRQPRWVTIQHIETSRRYPPMIEVWTHDWREGIDRDDQVRGLERNPINLVDVQVELP